MEEEVEEEPGVAIAADEIEETFEELIEEFTRKVPQVEEEEEEVDEEAAARRKQAKKRKTRVVEYDPELGEMVVKRRRKRDDYGDWEG